MESKSFLFGLGFTLFSITSFSQQSDLWTKTDRSLIGEKNCFEGKTIHKTTELNFFRPARKEECSIASNLKIKAGMDNYFTKKKYSLPKTENNVTLVTPQYSIQTPKIELGMNKKNNDFFLNNRRNRYSALWAFTSLNYLYADLVGLMDKNMLTQYQNGVVDGTKITPNFLTAAAGYMQIPLCNVFLPQVIKNERTLKWVQIASGIIMTLAQSGTLFLGTPTPYYMLFSAIEIGTTAYITFDAIKWKVPKSKLIE